MSGNIALARSIVSYPVWQYVAQVYFFAKNGMNVDGFRRVLYSNWEYYTKKSGHKWDFYLGEFRLIENFLEGKKSSKDWILEIEKLKELKKNIDRDILYKYHPIAKVKNSSLDFFHELFVEIAQVLEQINFTGTPKEHLEVFNLYVLGQTHILSTDIDKAEKGMEIFVIGKLREAIKSLDITNFSKNEISVADFYEYLLNEITAMSVDVYKSNYCVPPKEETQEFSKPLPIVCIGSKNQYSLHELATFKLCPKLYFHRHIGEGASYGSHLQLKYYFQAILFANLMDEFMECNAKEQKTYSNDNDECLNVLLSLLEDVFRRHIAFFDFLNEQEKEDVKTTLYDKIMNFINYDIKGKDKNGEFSTLRAFPKDIAGDDYKLILGYDMYIKHGKTKKLYQNDLGIHYLDSGERLQSISYRHYADIIDALDSDDANVDRVSLISRIINKINIQFDSGSPKFAGDGLKRTDALAKEIKEYDFGRAKGKVSDYCGYCPAWDVCREV